MSISSRYKAWWKKRFHKCSPAKYPDTGEIIIFHYDVPWSFHQTFTVCNECSRVKVLSENRNDNRGTYNKEIDGEKWSGNCDYGKIPSIGKDELIFS